MPKPREQRLIETVEESLQDPLRKRFTRPLGHLERPAKTKEQRFQLTELALRRRLVEAEILQLLASMSEPP